MENTLGALDTSEEEFINSLRQHSKKNDIWWFSFSTLPFKANYNLPSISWLKRLATIVLDIKFSICVDINQISIRRAQLNNPKKVDIELYDPESGIVAYTVSGYSFSEIKEWICTNFNMVELQSEVHHSKNNYFWIGYGFTTGKIDRMD